MPAKTNAQKPGTTPAPKAPVQKPAAQAAPAQKKVPAPKPEAEAKEKSVGRLRKEYCADLIAQQKFDDPTIADMVAKKFTDKEFPARRVGIVRDEINTGKRPPHVAGMKKLAVDPATGKLVDAATIKAEAKPKAEKRYTGRDPLKENGIVDYSKGPKPDGKAAPVGTPAGKPPAKPATPAKPSAPANRPSPAGARPQVPNNGKR